MELEKKYYVLRCKFAVNGTIKARVMVPYAPSLGSASRCSTIPNHGNSNCVSLSHVLKHPSIRVLDVALTPSTT
jgi:hypothetical protein